MQTNQFRVHTHLYLTLPHSQYFPCPKSTGAWTRQAGTARMPQSCRLTQASQS